MSEEACFVWKICVFLQFTHFYQTSMSLQKEALITVRIKVTYTCDSFSFSFYSCNFWRSLLDIRKDIQWQL